MHRPYHYNFLFGLILSLVWGIAKPVPASAATIHHYEYVLTAGFIYVYDIDNGFKLLKTVQVPTGAGLRGAVASAVTGMLYLSYGSDGDSGGFQLAYDLATDKVAWTMSYSHGIDSQSITPDGKKIYMPEGEQASGGTWYAEDTANGNDLATISTAGHGPHNTIVSPNGTRVYMADRDFTSSAGTNDFNIADTATNQIVAKITPLRSGARPFTINSAETLSFITVTGFMGFQVGDIAAGKVIFTVAVDGSNIPGFTTLTPASIPSHGISLSPDGKEIYLIDQPNSYVHVFDVTGLPGSAPVQVADIKLVNAISGNEAGCAYDCLKDGWIHHSRDGRFVFVGDSGDVIDTLTRKPIATLPQVADSRVEIEIDFQDSTPIWAATSRSGIGYVNPQPPTFTARITGPALGSTVSGSNVNVSTSVFDTVSISSVDLLIDGVLSASTTTSPYTFTWNTTNDSNGPHDLKVTANDTSGNSTSFLATFTVNNANPPPITATGGTPQKTLIGAAFGSALKATVKDSGGNPLSGIVVTFAVPAQTGASGTFAGGVNTATTNASGVATSAVITANGIAGGPYNVTASVAGSTASATFSLTNVDFAIAQSVPGAIQITAGTPANVTLALTTTPTGSPLPADVNFTCAAPASMSTTTCTLSPAKILANSPSGSTTTLTITSTASVPPPAKRQDPRTPYLPWAATTALAGLMVIYFAACQRIAPFRGRMAYLILALLVITSACLMGCGGAVSTQVVPSKSITVTATAGGISRTATVSFTVK